MMAKVKERVQALELNPIVVKELRQAVRSWAVVGALIVLTLVLFFTVMGMVGFSSVDLSFSRPVGRNVLEVIVTILNFVGILFIPAYVGTRVAAERQVGNMDLLYISTLSPARIIRGKMLSGAYVALLFYSICLPFMFFTNLLRGVDLPTIAIAVGFSFFMVIVAIQVAIFIAATPLTRGFKSVIALGLLFFVVPMVTGFVFSSFRMFRSGVGATIWGWSFWQGILPGAVLLLATVGLLHIMSIAMITPPTANRAMPVRIYITVVWFLTGAAAVALYVFQHTFWPFGLWMGVFTGLGMFAFLAAVSEPNHYSLRVRRDIPKSVPRRVLAYFFYNGASGGLLWAVAGVGSTITVFVYVTGWLETAHGYPRVPMGLENLGRIWAIVLYALAYALYGAALRRWFFSRRPPVLAGVFAVVLPTLWLVIPMITSFIWNNFRFDILERVHLGDPVNVFMPKMEPYWRSHLGCAAVMAAVGLVLNFRWLVAGMRGFKPLETESEAAKVA